jgi:hypothetical protein
VSHASCAFGVWANAPDVPEPQMFAGFCVMFGGWLAMVRLAGRLLPLLPISFQRVYPAAHHSYGVDWLLDSAA